MQASDFLNYGSAVASAFFAALSWWNSRKEARERARDALPVVECKPTWASYPSEQLVLDLVVTIRNNYNETIEIKKLKLRGGGATSISFEDRMSFLPVDGFLADVVKGTSLSINPKWEIFRNGSAIPAFIGGLKEGCVDQKTLHCFGLSGKPTKISLSVWVKRSGFASPRRCIVLRQKYALSANIANEKPANPQFSTTNIPQ